MNREKLVWVPAFLAGGSAATVAELSAGLLLYSGMGFLRALTVVLTLQMGAFALGLWTAWSPELRPSVDQMRRRWLFCLVAFTAAAGFAGVSRILGGQPSAPLGQGLGLALLGGLPMFAAGALLGSMGRLLGQGSRGGVTVGAGAASGAAMGFLLTGFFFVPTLEPSSTLLACVIALSGGALIHGWVLDQREVTEELESRWTARGLVRVEDWARGAPRARSRVILEGDRVRGSEHVEGGGEGGWEAAVLATVARGSPAVASVLVYGSGAGTLVRELRAEWGPAAKPDGDVDSAPTTEQSSIEGPDPAVEQERVGNSDPAADAVAISESTRIVGIEPNPVLHRMARAHYPPERDGDADPWAGIQLRDGILLQDLPASGERFDLVVVDAAALGPTDGMPAVSPTALRPALACLEPGGTLVIGGLSPPSAETRPGLDAWMNEAEALALDRLALVRGDEMLLVLAAAVDGRDWSGGETTELGRWSGPASAGSASPP